MLRRDGRRSRGQCSSMRNCVRPPGLGDKAGKKKQVGFNDRVRSLTDSRHKATALAGHKELRPEDVMYDNDDDDKIKSDSELHDVHHNDGSGGMAEPSEPDAKWPTSKKCSA